MKTCCCTIACKTGQWQPQQIIDLAAELVFDGIELWGRFLENASPQQLRQIRAACDAAGLAVAMISPYMGFFDLGKSNFHDMVAECRKFIEIAHIMGVKQIRSFAGFVGEVASASCDDANWAYAVNGFAEYAALAEQANVDLLIETHTNSLADSVQGIEKLLTAVPSRRLRLNLQLDEMVKLSNLTPPQIWQRLKGRVAHFHYRHWAEPTKQQQTRHLLGCMKRDNWDGFVSIEYVDGQTTADGVARVGLERLRDDWEAA